MRDRAEGCENQHQYRAGWDRWVKKGQLEQAGVRQDGQKGQPGKESRKRTARTGLPANTGQEYPSYFFLYRSLYLFFGPPLFPSLYPSLCLFFGPSLFPPSISPSIPPSITSSVPTY
jgi:hypothetical protein